MWANQPTLQLNKLKLLQYAKEQEIYLHIVFLTSKKRNITLLPK